MRGPVSSGERVRSFPRYHPNRHHQTNSMQSASAEAAPPLPVEAVACGLEVASPVPPEFPPVVADVVAVEPDVALPSVPTVDDAAPVPPELPEPPEVAVSPTVTAPEPPELPEWPVEPDDDVAVGVDVIDASPDESDQSEFSLSEQSPSLVVPVLAVAEADDSPESPLSPE